MSVWAHGSYVSNVVTDLKHNTLRPGSDAYQQENGQQMEQITATQTTWVCPIEIMFCERSRS